MHKYYLLASILLINCGGIPEGIDAIDGFEINRYLGTWYEIARLDHRFERGLENISATYTPLGDGGINVINKGWDQQKRRWKQAEGKAYFVGQANKGQLKVSFFGPFYGGYNIIELDKKNYAYSMVAGPDKSYLWVLSRTKQLPKPVLDKLVDRAKQLGFSVEKLIFVKQD